MTICERMFEELYKRGLNAYGLSKKLGVGTTTTTNWKQRGTDPPAKFIVPICEYLGCSVEYLLTGHEAETEKAPIPGISENGREMLELYEKLPERKQIEMIGYIRRMVDESKISGYCGGSQSSPSRPSTQDGRAV